MPLNLKSDDGTEFEIAFIEERFEDLQDDEQDDAWAIITFRAASGDESWEETAPCMNPFEVENLVEWFTALGSGAVELGAVELLEIGLGFSVDDEDEATVTIRVDFHLEDRPEWSKMDAPTDEADAITLRVPREQVAAAAASLDDDVRRLARGGD